MIKNNRYICMYTIYITGYSYVQQAGDRRGGVTGMQVRSAIALVAVLRV